MTTHSSVCGGRKKLIFSAIEYVVNVRAKTDAK